MEDSPVKKALKVMLVDDHPVVREGLRAILSNDPEIEVIAEASNGEQAVEKARQCVPDVVLTDIRMPGINGIEVTRQIKAVQPGIAVIVLTMYDSDMYVVEALRAGAAGYLVKDSSREFVCHAIKAAVDGSTMVRSELLHRAIQGLLRVRQHPAEGEEPMMVSRFTLRELDVLGLVTKGYANREIADELHLAEVTVKKHVQNIIGKLGASDRTHAAIMAVQMGLLQ
jgi:DNA-binding NarL/FixJ family response regulator